VTARGLILPLVLVASVAWAGVQKGQRAPEFALPTLKGGKVSLARLRGKVVLIDFWAQWCEPCKKELPQLEKLSRDYNGRGVVILTINIDKQRGNAERLAKQLGLTLDVLLDPAGSVAATYDPPKMPSSFVVDQRGIVRYVNEGFEGEKDVARFRQELDELSSRP
jgi:cytochrome c biogenesis protein CcmG/thiol:disulfide interchange protein DsbE